MHLEYLKNYFYLFKTIFGKQKWQILFLVFLGFINGILDSIGIGALIPLFGIIAKDRSAAADRVSDFVQHFFSYFGANLSLRSLLIFMAIVFVVKAIGEFWVAYIRVSVIAQYENDMRTGLYRKTLMARWPYLMQQKIGHLENILMNDVRATTGLLNRICNVAPSMASFVVYLFFALKTSVPITMITMGIGSVILLFTKPISNRVKRYTTELTGINKAVAHRVNENVQGMKMVKALAIEDDIAKNEENSFDRLRHLSIKSTFFKQLGTGFTEPIIFIFVSFVFAFSYSRPGFSIGSFVVVMYLIQRLFNSVNKVQGSLLVVSEAMPYAYHVIGLDHATQENKEEDPGSAPFQLEDQLQFKQVSFAYRPEEPILDMISFAVKKNEMVGIIGPSGAGKTTIADLMLRLFNPMSGEIFIDGKNISSMQLKDLRKNIGYVSQDIFLKNDTVENNIRFYAKDVSETEMIEATKMANIYDFIINLPKGFQTIIGDRGVLLSGGQRQRIVFARTLVRKPKILVLDEATSALDNESESLIRKSIESLKGEITVIIIAHRLSTVMNCDRLLALDRGKIIESGTPAELLSSKESYFYKVHHLQQEG